MSRTTACEVKAIRPTDVDVEPMIVAANAVVTRINTESGKTFTDDDLAAIELWLAAHLVGTIDPVVAKEKFENSDITYMVGKTDLTGVMSDKYGQTANMLARGCLADLDKPLACVTFVQ
jgi:predicted Zn-dependent protease